MNKLYRITSMILVFSLLASAHIPVFAALDSDESEKSRVVLLTAAPNPAGKTERTNPPIEPDLLRALIEAESGGSEYVRVVVYLREQTDLDTTTRTRARVVSTLQTQADQTQAPLRAYLQDAQTAGQVDSYTPYWIFNGIAVRARPATIRALIAHPDADAVRLDHWRQWVTPALQDLPIGSARLTAGSNPQTPSTPEWGVSRIRADQVWASLLISGTGAVVAGMDTGVDWFHPALQTTYRGYNPHGPSNHVYNWYDATGDGAIYPVDANGHGSHTMGSIVGQDGIGVAPGARWIAVRMLDQQGFGYDSWIHAAFQWLMAPGGDSDRAPDVVNNSWGSSYGTLTNFQLDLQALRAAGIFAVFSNGNNGPGSGTVGSPASLPEAFAVGATDPDDEIADFSSRGPSPWGDVRPHVAAPGVNVRSTFPGGAYMYGNGTSMAAPHVSGIAALLHSVSPTLSITHTAFLITSTTVPLTISIPNNNSGWGRVDAFAAVAALAQPALITGTVMWDGDSTPVAGASVVATHRAGVGGGQATTGENGSYLIALAPASYDLTASAFGYAPETILAVAAMTGTTTAVDFSLVPLPIGDLHARVTSAATALPLAATITVLGTPLQATGSAHTFTLPQGDYIVRARALGYRVITATVRIIAGQTTVADLILPTAPSILLIDSGAWYYESQIDYFCQALDDLQYAYDEWTVKHLPDDVPAANNLLPYDIVIWSAPTDAPGFIGAEDAIIGYLSAGGRLLLSGQDVGLLDGGGLWSYWSTYYSKYLKARYLSDQAPTRVLEGMEGDIFAGLTITITGPDGADNQEYPDEIEVADPDFAAPLLAYKQGDCGGLRVGTCLDYRAIYLSFGFEAINSRATRQKVMSRSLDWLTSPLPTVGMELQPASQTRIGVLDSIITHTLRARHLGQAGVTDTVALALDGGAWETQLGAPSISLSPCNSATVVVTVTIPPSAGWDARDVVTLTARSSLSVTLVRTAVLTTKTPAPILLVDDERWYDLEYRYEAALTGAGFAYDYWLTGWPDRYTPPKDGPPLEILQRYPVVVWFTGYDWYKPVTADEMATLAAYLDGGGRLFLSSQDFLYYHHDDAFSQNYLGVVAHTGDVTLTVASGAPGDPIGDRLGPYTLDHVFRNWSDTVVPAPDVAAAFHDQDRLPIGLARQADNYKSVFFAFPFEALPQVGRAEVMERVVGWLNWMGGSTFSADRETASGNDTLTYTAILRNDGPETVSASFSNTLPISLTLVPGSLSGPAAYDPATHRFAWQNPVEPGMAVTFSYRVTVAMGIATGATVVNTARLGLEDQKIYFYRDAVVRANAPDLSPSALGCNPPFAWPNAVVACTLALANIGLGDAVQAEALVVLPRDTTLVPGSPSWTGGGTVHVPTGTIRTPTGTVQWNGPLSAGSQVTLGYQITMPAGLEHPPLYSAAHIKDGVGGAWQRAMWLWENPPHVYLPLVVRE